MRWEGVLSGIQPSQKDMGFPYVLKLSCLLILEALMYCFTHLKYVHQQFTFLSLNRLVQNKYMCTQVAQCLETAFKLFLIWLICILQENPWKAALWPSFSVWGQKLYLQGVMGDTGMNVFKNIRKNSKMSLKEWPVLITKDMHRSSRTGKC